MHCCLVFNMFSGILQYPSKDLLSIQSVPNFAVLWSYFRSAVGFVFVLLDLHKCFQSIPPACWHHSEWHPSFYHITSFPGLMSSVSYLSFHFVPSSRALMRPCIDSQEKIFFADCQINPLTIILWVFSFIEFFTHYIPLGPKQVQWDLKDLSTPMYLLCKESIDFPKGSPTPRKQTPGNYLQTKRKRLWHWRYWEQGSSKSFSDQQPGIVMKGLSQC